MRASCKMQEHRTRKPQSKESLSSTVEVTGWANSYCKHKGSIKSRHKAQGTTEKAEMNSAGGSRYTSQWKRHACFIQEGLLETHYCRKREERRILQTETLCVHKEPKLGRNLKLASPAEGQSKRWLTQRGNESRAYMQGPNQTRPCIPCYTLRFNLHSRPGRPCGATTSCNQGSDMIRTAFQKTHPESNGEARPE